MPGTDGAEPQVQTPTGVRYVVLLLLGVLAFVLYLDRICISQAAEDIMSADEGLGLSKAEMSDIFSAFTLAYCLFEVWTGGLGDRYGSRGVLVRIVLWWSVFTALSGAALGYWSLLAVRFLFGAGEAGAFPNAARVIARWFPPDRRGPAQGLFNTTALIGGAAAPVVAAYLIQYVGWRWAFALFALPGVLWAVVFFCWYRDDPAEHPAVNDAERRLIAGSGPAPGGAAHPPIPWRRVLTCANVWLLGGVIACTAFNSYLYFFWYPTYLKDGRGVDEILTGWLSGLVLLGGAAGSTLGGFVIDALVRHTGNRRRSRRGLGFTALTGAALLLFVGVNTEMASLSACWTAGSFFLASATLACWWGAVSDISGRHLGAMFGLMNSLGGFGAFTSQQFFGRFVEYLEDLGYTGRDQFDPTFYVFVGVLLLGACGWLLIDSTRPIEPTTDVPTDDRCVAPESATTQ